MRLLPCESLPCFGSFRVSVKIGRGTIVYHLHSIVETAIKEWGEEGLMEIMEVEVAPNHFEWNPLFSMVWKDLRGVALLFLSVLGESHFPFAYCGMTTPVPSTHRALSGLGSFSHVLPFTSASAWLHLPWPECHLLGEVSSDLLSKLRASSHSSFSLPPIVLYYHTLVSS